MDFHIRVTGTITVLHKIVSDDSMTAAEQTAEATRLSQDADKITQASEAASKSAAALTDLK